MNGHCGFHDTGKISKKEELLCAPCGEPRYNDMLDLPHHVSSVHPQMSPENRAAQFSPFAALSGYEEQLDETARLTDGRIELSEEKKSRLDEKLRMIQEQLLSRSDHPGMAFPTVSITFFRPDVSKSGGKYSTISGAVKKIDPYERRILFCAGNDNSDGESISIDDITEIIL